MLKHQQFSILLSIYTSIIDRNPCPRFPCKILYKNLYKNPNEFFCLGFSIESCIYARTVHLNSNGLGIKSVPRGLG